MIDVTVPVIVGGALAVSAVVMAPATKYAIDLSPFLFTNTRISGKSGALLKKKFYEELITSSSYKESLGILEDSYYYSIVEQNKEFNSISSNLENDLFDTYTWLENVVPDQVKPFIKSILIKHEINEIKKVINCLSKNNSIPELNHIIDTDLKLRLETVKDFGTLQGSLEGTEYEEIFSGKDLTNLEVLNTAIDLFYYNKLMEQVFTSKDSSISGPFKDYFMALVDIVNIKLILRKIGNSLNVSLIKGGSIDIHDLTGITELAQLESLLSITNYATSISEMKPDDIELGMHRSLLNLAGLIGAKYSLKAGSLVKYIILKELEVRNLNIILKLKSAGFDQNEYEKLLVI